MATKEQRPLTAKQRAFCEHYVTDAEYSATKAYLLAFDATQQTAQTQGPKLTHDPRVQEYVHELQKEGLRATGLSAEKVLKSLQDMAFNSDLAPGLKLKAIDLLSKNMGLQKTVVESDNVTISVDIEDSHECQDRTEK